MAFGPSEDVSHQINLFLLPYFMHAHSFDEEYKKSTVDCVPHPHEKFHIADYLLNPANFDVNQRANLLLYFNREMYR